MRKNAFLAVLILLVIALAAPIVCSQTYADPGHPAEEIGGGTFNDGFGDFIFPEGVDVIVDDNIGIGTSSPASKLHVQNGAVLGNNSGAASMTLLSTGVVGIGSSYGVVGKYNNTIYGYLGSNDYGVYGQRSSTNYGYLGSANYGAYGRYSASNYGYLGANGYGVFGNGSVWGGYFDGIVNVTGTLYSPNFTSSSDMRIKTGSTTRMFADESTGNIGIATEVPTATLYVNGTSRFDEEARIMSRVGIGTDSPSQMLEVDGKMNVTGKLYSGNGTIVLDGTTNRIGIGTKTPSAAVHVQSGTVIGNNSGAGSLTSGTGVYGTGSVYAVFGRNDADTYGFLGNNSYGAYGQYSSTIKGYLGSTSYGSYGQYSSTRYGYLGGSTGYGAYGQYDANIKGYLGGNSYGAYGQYDSNILGYLGSSSVGAFGRYSSTRYGYLSNTSSNYGAYGQYGTNTMQGYLGGSGQGLYVQTSSSGRSGWLGGNEHGVAGVYDADTYGILGYSSYGAVGRYDTNIWGNLGGASYGAYGAYTSSRYGYLGGSNTGLYGQYDANIKGSVGNGTYGAYGQYTAAGRYGWLASSTVGLYGRYDANILGYAGSNNYGAYGQYTTTRYGFLGNSTYGAYGQYDSSKKGYLGGSSYGLYGQNDSDTYGYLGGSSYGAFGQYNSNRQGYLGSSSYGAYGRYNSTIYGYLGSISYGAYGQYDSSLFGYLGGSTYGLAGYADGLGEYGIIAGSSYTAIMSNGSFIIESGGMCIENYSEVCDSESTGDGDFAILNGYLCTSYMSSYCDNLNSNIDSGDLLIMDGALCVGDWSAGYECNKSKSDGYIYARQTSITEIDLAENFPSSDANLEPGDVVGINTMLGEKCVMEKILEEEDVDENISEDEDDEEYAEQCKNETSFVPFVSKSDAAFSTKSIGIVSTDPGILLGGFGHNEFGHYDQVAVALAGRVPVKATDENGCIAVGDFLTSSSRPGYAMKWSLLDVSQAEDFEELKEMLAENKKRRGAIIGKALEPLDSGDGKILAFVTLQ